VTACLPAVVTATFACCVRVYLQQRETKRAAALKAAAARVHAKRQAEKERAANDAYIRQVYCGTSITDDSLLPYTILQHATPQLAVIVSMLVRHAALYIACISHARTSILINHAYKVSLVVQLCKASVHAYVCSKHTLCTYMSNLTMHVFIFIY
jgi:hypothetical protein